MRIVIAGLIALLAAGCATVPEAVREAPAQAPDVSAVRAAPETYVGERVRWGGTIAEVVNEADRTLVAVVARPLDNSARPRQGADSGGRFLARMDEFLDPAVYSVGRELTVVGTLDGTRNRTIGDYAYEYPMVAVSGHVLWQPREPRRDPRWADSYGPWWGYPYRYPWHHRYHPHHFHNPYWW